MNGAGDFLIEVMAPKPGDLAGALAREIENLQRAQAVVESVLTAETPGEGVGRASQAANAVRSAMASLAFVHADLVKFAAMVQTVAVLKKDEEGS